MYWKRRSIQISIQKLYSQVHKCTTTEHHRSHLGKIYDVQNSQRKGLFTSNEIEPITDIPTASHGSKISQSGGDNSREGIIFAKNCMIMKKLDWEGACILRATSSSGSSGWAEGPRNMKSMRSPSAAIFFMTSLPPPDPLLPRFVNGVVLIYLVPAIFFMKRHSMCESSLFLPSTFTWKIYEWF